MYDYFRDNLPLSVELVQPQASSSSFICHPSQRRMTAIHLWIFDVPSTARVRFDERAKIITWRFCYLHIGVSTRKPYFFRMWSLSSIKSTLCFFGDIVRATRQTISLVCVLRKEFNPPLIERQSVAKECDMGHPACCSR